VSTDVAYITAAQQNTYRGYLMYGCNVTSAKPGTETASAYLSKPGEFGRPWQATTSEVVFYNTTIEATDNPSFTGKSMIAPEGWLNSLGGTSSKMYEYGTIELSGENNTSSRAAWSTILSTPTLTDSTPITTFNFTKGTDGWDPLSSLIIADISTRVVIPQSTSSVQIYTSEDKLFISNVKSNIRVEIYGLDGVMVQNCETGVDTNITLNKGVWIVKAMAFDGNKVIKVIAK